MEAWAHSSGLTLSGNSKPGHLLADHLHAVAALAAEFSDGFGSREWGYLAGLWHDLGKYRDGFQRYIDGLASVRECVQCPCLRDTPLG